MASTDGSTVSKLLGTGLARQGAVRRREDIEIAMEESMMEIIPQLEKRTAYVALGANIATLLGLLGTIIGLIQAFTAVANANPAEKADLLSASISVAMNTTAFGLVVAIPLLVTHSVLTAKTGEIVDSPRDGLGQGPQRDLDAREAPGPGVASMARAHHYRRRQKEEAPELDMTTFLNLMVVLVPFLLITAVFSRITIVELDLPSATGRRRRSPRSGSRSSCARPASRSWTARK